MKGYKDYFKGKKVTIMGLGLLGRGVGDAEFLARQGAILTVTDLKSKAELATSLKRLSKFKNIKYTLGKHDLKDFQHADMIVMAAGVSVDSPYIKEARKNNIPIEMDASLFAKLAQGVKIVGITGTRGKSMTTSISYEILHQSEKFLGQKVYLGGNVRGTATLPLLSKVKEGDVVVLELDSWQCQGFGEQKISPHVAVFTSFMRDHMNYYKNNMKEYFSDKANIFKYQKKGDVLIIRPGMKKLVKNTDTKGKLVVALPKITKNYHFVVPGKYQNENFACALEVAKHFGIPVANIAKTMNNFKGLEGRLEYMKSVGGIKIYNDNNATTPEATIAALEALNQKVILIIGGADKTLDMKPLIKILPKYTKKIVLLPGTGTDKLIKNYELGVKNEKAKNLNEAVRAARSGALRGDIILLSPAFASFGLFTNEYDRNDQFVKLIKALK
jgi:UDP-N-acetylmuramoylalanine--D-glutamate ligase